MIRLAALSILAVVWTLPAAAALRFDDSAEQGALIRGTADPGTVVAVDGRPVRVDDQGRFVFGLGRDAPSTVTVTASLGTAPTETVTLQVARRDWQVQRIDGLPPSKVTPDPKTLERILRERDQINAVRAVDRASDDWASGFIWPADGRISGVFGSQRILNGTPRAPHSGVDIAAPTGAPVRATAAGVVVMAEPDLVLTGGTILIDHGAGILSVYAHMSRLDVRSGQIVAQGEPIGAIGATGRATGPHLHFGLSWFEVKLDPQTVLPKQPDSTGLGERR